MTPSRKLIALLAIAWCATALSAETPQPRARHGWPQLLDSYDSDGDGSISRDEFARWEARFEQLDQDGDGVLSEADFPRHRRHPAAGARIVAHADSDRDGTVTAEEWQTFRTQLDQDGDGTVEPDALRAAIMPRRAAGALEGEADHRFPLLRRIDTDGDGSLAVAELDAAFAALDQDHSGALEAGELPRMRHRRGGRGERHLGRRFRGELRLLPAADSDGDDEVTEAEWQRFLDHTDSDGDGTVSGEEMRLALELPPPPADRQARHPGIPVDRLSELFTRLDADGDGVVTAAERPRMRHPRGGR